MLFFQCFSLFICTQSNYVLYRVLEILLYTEGQKCTTSSSDCIPWHPDSYLWLELPHLRLSLAPTPPLQHTRNTQIIQGKVQVDSFLSYLAPLYLLERLYTLISLDFSVPCCRVKHSNLIITDPSDMSDYFSFALNYFLHFRLSPSCLFVVIWCNVRLVGLLILVW